MTQQDAIQLMRSIEVTTQCPTNLIAWLTDDEAQHRRVILWKKQWTYSVPAQGLRADMEADLR